MNKKEKTGKSPFWKKWWFWAIIVVVIIVGGMLPNEPQEDSPAVATAGPTETEKTELVNNTRDAEMQHLYDNAIVKDVMNGFRSEKIGEYSIATIKSDQVTQDILEDWYFNYVEKNDFNWSMTRKTKVFMLFQVLLAKMWHSR